MNCLYSLNVMIAVVVFSTSLHADDIALKNAVRLEPNASTVTLGDIAELNGPDAAALQDFVILDSPPTDQTVEISIADVRAKLNDAGVHWGRVNLSGRTVIIRPVHRLANAPLAMTPISLGRDIEHKPRHESPFDELLAAELVGEPTVRGIIAGFIASNLHVQPNDMRLRFRNSDRSVLMQALDTGRFEIQPLGSFSSDRVELSVRLWENSQVRQTWSVAVEPLVRMKAAVLRRDLARNETIIDADVDEREQWLSPALASQIVGRISAVGRLATRSLKAGEMIHRANVRRETLVERGDPVMVRCLVGGVAISLQAVARADGSEGDAIEVRKVGERESFLATVTGRGEVVIDLGNH